MTTLDIVQATSTEVSADLLQLRNVTCNYGPERGIQNVSIDVTEGSQVCLLGPSGCGKTTVLRAIAGLQSVSAGSIHIGGREVSGPNLSLPPERRRIGMVFQDHALFPNLTVSENVGAGLRNMNSHNRQRSVRELLERMGLELHAARYPHELSGGQQQRVALGRALVRDPAVFLMDEPLSNLDAKLRVQMRSELKRFHHNLDATVIYVTHDQLEAVTMADKMAVMSGGVLQQYDTPANVFAQPVNTFVASFVGSPAMSLIPLTAASRGSETVLTSPEGWALPLSPENARKAQKSSTPSVVLGARHSTLKLHKAKVAGSVPGKVYTVEPTGDVTFAQIFISEAVVNISLDPSVRIEPDEEVWIEFDQVRMHLFDAETTMALQA